MGVIDLEQVVFAQSVVGRKAPVGFQSLPRGGIVAIAIPTAIHLQALTSGNGGTRHRIPTVALVRTSLRRTAVTVYIFAARLPTPHIHEAKCIALALELKRRFRRIGETAVPTESADRKPFHGTDPQTADQILEVVDICVIDTLSVEQPHLIVQEFTTTCHREKVTLHLHTDVTTARSVLPDSVVETLQFRSHLREATESHCDAGNRFFKAERTVVLSEAHLRLREFAPLHIRIEQTRPAINARCTTHLHLKAIENVTPSITATVKTEIAHRKIARSCSTFAVGQLILRGNVSPERHRGFERGTTLRLLVRSLRGHLRNTVGYRSARRRQLVRMSSCNTTAQRGTEEKKSSFHLKGSEFEMQNYEICERYADYHARKSAKLCLHTAQRIACCASLYAMRRKAHGLSTYFCNVG